MVNFKASGHAGEHKRALAAQTTEHKAVSKAEKLAWSQKEGMLAAVPADLPKKERWKRIAALVETKAPSECARRYLDIRRALLAQRDA